MNRRELLGRVAGLGAVGTLAGCLASSGGGGGDDGDGGGGDGDSGGGGPTPTPTPTPTVSDRSIRTVEAGCGSGGEASVAFEDAAVAITGTIQAPDPCHRATLAGATYDGDTGRLRVSVGVTEGSGGVCSQCIAGVEYEARVAFEGGLPDEVVVDHDGEDVATTAR